MKKNCDTCGFRNCHPKAIRFCLALCEFVDDPDEMPCEGDLYVEPEEEDRKEFIVDKLEELRG